MDNKIFEQLQEFENHLFTAYKCNYVRMLNRNTAGKLAEIYEQLYNQKSRILNGCGHCVLTDLKRMGEEYFKYKEIYQFVEEQQNIQPIDEEPVELIQSVEETEPAPESEPIEEPQPIEESEPIVILEVNEQVEIQPEPIVVTDSKSSKRARSNNNKATNKDKK